MNFVKKFIESKAPKPESTDKSGVPAADHQGQGDLFSSAKLVADAASSTFQKEPATKYDNAEVAGAAANLLDAAQTYGKLDNTTGVGSYVEKGENYLREYETSHTTKPEATEEIAGAGKVAKPSSEEIPGQEKVEPVKPTSDEPKPETEDAPSEVKTEEEEPIKDETKPSTEEEEEETKPSYGGKGGEEEEEEVPSESSAKPSAKEPETEPKSEIPGGVGEYAKIDEGFLKKGDSAEDDDAGESDQIGQYANAAEGFLNKKSEGSAADDHESSKTTGLGGVAKLAGNFLK